LLAPGAQDPRTDSRPADELIRDARQAADGPVWLATVGPATNAAVALHRHPELRERLAGVAMMGGRHDPADPHEYNFSSDPEAAAAVCNSGLGVRVGDYLVTCQAKLTVDDLPSVRRAPGVGGSLAAMLAAYLERRERDWTSMYDPAALTLALGERFLTLDPQPLEADVSEGHVRFLRADQPTRLRAAASIDPAAFRANLLDVIGAVQE
jgi:inosine-uridine nucleoside N-ribohydrolase